MDWYQTALHRPMTTLFWQLIRTDAEIRDYALVEDAIAECAVYWTMLDRHLEQRPFLLGSDISMADIPLGCAAYRWHSMSFERPNLPALRAWHNCLSERSAYQNHVMLPLT